MVVTAKKVNAYEGVGRSNFRNLIGRSLASRAAATSIGRRLGFAATRSSLRFEVLLRLDALLGRRGLGGQVLMDALL